MTGRCDTDDVYRLLESALCYNVGVEVVEKVLRKLKECDVQLSPFGDFQEWNEDECLNLYWTMFVLLYGDYGTSPRSGWIHKTPESIKFFEDMVEDLEDD